MHHSDHVIPDQPRPLPDGPLYFVGVGGAGMSSIAQVLAERGRRIAGADPGIALVVKARLEAVGVEVYTQHDDSQLKDAVAVVVSDAIPAANPEVRAAQAKGLPIFRRPEVLGSIVNAGRGIAIAGTHGKTTTTGMVASILLAAGLDPTILIGGDLPAIGGNARNGKSEFVVAESCEAYDGFLYLHPEIAVVLNIEADHLDYHGTEEHVFDSFKRFIHQIKPKGTLIASEVNDALSRMFPAGSRIGDQNPHLGGIVSTGFAGDIWTEKFEAHNGGSAFVAVSGNDFHEPITLKVPGRHNVLNALAAIGVARTLGIAPEHLVAGLEAFTGTGRRFERIGQAQGVLIVDDYAHHPTEIRATLAAARSAYPDRRLVAVFQPHLPSRTRDLLDDFAGALTAADAVYVTDIYLAREQPIPGISSEVLVDRIQSRRPDLSSAYIADKNDLPPRLAAEVRDRDLVLTMGAGDIRAAGEGLLAILSTGDNHGG
ncbi:MAG: UDP-N-acetylmuramate--L-alanine ligase [Cytophagales bacterium]|nr:UDP-N-acetylmuramate--L-alanine ligase [Armatimonadota bacterium]